MTLNVHYVSTIPNYRTSGTVVDKLAGLAQLRRYGGSRGGRLKPPKFLSHREKGSYIKSTTDNNINKILYNFINSNTLSYSKITEYFSLFSLI